VKVILMTALAIFVGACATPNRLVYSSGFSFANYDYIIIGKPDGQATATSLYGMDVEFANLLSKYNMNVIGDKEFASMSAEKQKRTLVTRMSVSASDNRIVFTVSFDDAATGRTGSSVTGSAKGDIFDGDDRGEAFESVSSTVVKALQKDKGLQITDEKKGIF
jgi:hypothetical protein